MDSRKKLATWLIVAVAACFLLIILIFNRFAIKKAIENTLETVMGGEPVTFQTQDGVEIFGLLFKSETSSGKKAVLLHMLGKNSSDWISLTKGLNDAGFDTLTIDLRGHGKSGGGNWEEFPESEFGKMVLDASAGANYLRNSQSGQISFIGASIGANVALNYASSDPNVKALVLLSPGLNYKGVETVNVAKKYSGPVLIITSSNDPQSYEGLPTWEKSIKDLEIITYTDAGHGTDMFKTHPDLEGKIIEWLNKKISP